MKLLLTQYLASLKEREELDVVLPDVLSALGFNVISRPKRGTTQYGVDAAAVGVNPRTSKKSLFLLSIKSGNLSRSQWSEGTQSLRSSLEEILDVYIQSHVADQHRDLPIVIAMCFGGDMQENVRAQVTGFRNKHTQQGKIEFEEWNGDYIAELILTGLLRENVFPKSMQASFRKALAFADEPDTCVAHFQELLFQLFANQDRNHADRLRVARQIYLASWNVFAWCRDANNLDAAYRTAAMSSLWMWDLFREHLGDSKRGRELADVMDNMISLFGMIAAGYVAKHVTPYSKVENGLGVSVRPWASVDVNLKLFEALGRVAIHGLWLLHTRGIAEVAAREDDLKKIDVDIQKSIETIADMIDSNPVFRAPLRDDHAVEIMLVGIFLAKCGADGFLAGWLKEIARSCVFSYRSRGQYPCILRDYADLAAHPKADDEYREEVTVGSVLYPTLAIWLAILGEDERVKELAEFRVTSMTHSTWQIWTPDDVSEKYYYRNTGVHGAAIAEIGVGEGTEKLIEQLNNEIEASVDFGKLSAIRYGLWPLLLMASHLYRLPVPIHFWLLASRREQPAD